MVERINYKLLTLTYIALQRGIPDRSEKIVSNLSLLVVGVIRRIKSIFFDFNFNNNSESSSGCKSTIIRQSTPFF